MKEVVIVSGKNKNNRNMFFIFTITKEFWVTSDGKKITIDKLNTNHIYNIIKGFQSGKIPPYYLGGKNKWLKILKKELKKRNIK